VKIGKTLLFGLKKKNNTHHKGVGGDSGCGKSGQTGRGLNRPGGGWGSLASKKRKGPYETPGRREVTKQDIHESKAG